MKKKEKQQPSAKPASHSSELSSNLDSGDTAAQTDSKKRSETPEPCPLKLKNTAASVIQYLYYVANLEIRTFETTPTKNNLDLLNEQIIQLVLFIYNNKIPPNELEQACSNANSQTQRLLFEQIWDWNASDGEEKQLLLLKKIVYKFDPKNQIFLDESKNQKTEKAKQPITLDELLTLANNNTRLCKQIKNSFSAYTTINTAPQCSSSRSFIGTDSKTNQRLSNHSGNFPEDQNASPEFSDGTQTQQHQIQTPHYLNPILGNDAFTLFAKNSKLKPDILLHDLQTAVTNLQEDRLNTDDKVKYLHLILNLLNNSVAVNTFSSVSEKTTGINSNSAYKSAILAIQKETRTILQSTLKASTPQSISMETGQKICQIFAQYPAYFRTTEYKAAQKNGMVTTILNHKEKILAEIDETIGDKSAFLKAANSNGKLSIYEATAKIRTLYEMLQSIKGKSILRKGRYTNEGKYIDTESYQKALKQIQSVTLKVLEKTPTEQLSNDCFSRANHILAASSYTRNKFNFWQGITSAYRKNNDLPANEEYQTPKKINPQQTVVDQPEDQKSQTSQASSTLSSNFKR